jgi:hypothetical protein
MHMSFNATDFPETFRPRELFIVLDQRSLQFKQRGVIWGNVQSTHESICGIVVNNIKLWPNVSMSNGGKEMLLKQLSILAVGFRMQ